MRRSCSEINNAKNRIIDYLAQHGESYHREIEQELNLSDRTFRRYKQQLIDEGQPIEDYLQIRENGEVYKGIRLKPSYFKDRHITQPYLFDQLIDLLLKGGRVEDTLTEEQRTRMVAELQRLKRAPGPMSTE